MIKVTCYLNKDNQYIGIVANGHANYDEYGKDIICSAVSAIMVGGCNAIENISDFDVQIDEGNTSLKFIGKKISDNDLVVIRTMVIQLKTIEESYSKYIKICEVKNNGA